MTFEKQKNIIKRHEAWRVYGALLRAAGHCVHDLLKMFPVLPSLPVHSTLKNKGKVVTTPPKKRKASMEQLDEQQPQKKTAVATDSPVVAALNNTASATDIQIDTANKSPPSDMQVGVAATTTVSNSGVSDVNPSPSTQASDETSSSSKVRPVKDGIKRSINRSAILNQVWKEELNSGQLLVSV